jgi:peptidoglycan-associated lipoprotein
MFAVAVLGSAWMLGCAHEPAVAEAPPPPARVAQSAPPPPAPAQPAINWAVVLEEALIFFDFDKSDLKPESQASLQRLAPLLRANPNVRIQIAGNCDERGTEEYNLHLGERRANAAEEYLVDLGVNAAQVDTISYGFERPVDPAHNENAWALNRRDEFVPQRISAETPTEEPPVGARSR